MKLFFIFMMFLSISYSAEELKSSAEKIIKDAGVPIFTGSIFTNGSKEIGFRFATNESVEKVREWYKKELSKWSLFDKFGSWMLYNGEPGKGMADVMSVNHITVAENENLPEWFKLDKNMTTEIVIMIVK